jgi:peptidoglycan/xylan/chitin deacetylase (PgdA/CDA1 family)
VNRTLAGVLAATVAALAFAACDDGGGTGPGTATAPAVASPSASPERSDTATPAATPTPAQTPLSTPGGPARAVYRGDAARRAVALTFDAGSDAGYTREILETLRAAGIRAAFSLTGVWAEENRDLARLIAAEGHALINHSYSHPSFTGRSTGTAPLTAEERALELSRTETTVYRLTLRSTRPYFRPPFGDTDDSVLADAGAAGYGIVMMWSIDTLGWRGATADEIVERSLALAEPGAIYIMHVGSASADAAALPRVIAGLREEGYEILPLDEFLQ